MNLVLSLLKSVARSYSMSRDPLWRSLACFAAAVSNRSNPRLAPTDGSIHAF